MDNDPAIALYLGAGAVALGFGVLTYCVGLWVGMRIGRRRRSDRD